MPFYEYINDSGDACSHCREPFTVLQKISDHRLSQCPECGAPVRRLISAPNVMGKQDDVLKPSNIEKAGFTQYRKIGKGVYEKSAGKKGPGIISAD